MQANPMAPLHPAKSLILHLERLQSLTFSFDRRQAGRLERANSARGSATGLAAWMSPGSPSAATPRAGADDAGSCVAPGPLGWGVPSDPSMPPMPPPPTAGTPHPHALHALSQPPASHHHMLGAADHLAAEAAAGGRCASPVLLASRLLGPCPLPHSGRASPRLPLTAGWPSAGRPHGQHAWGRPELTLRSRLQHAAGGSADLSDGGTGLAAGLRRTASAGHTDGGMPPPHSPGAGASPHSGVDAASAPGTSCGSPAAKPQPSDTLLAEPAAPPLLDQMDTGENSFVSFGALLLGCYKHARPFASDASCGTFSQYVSAPPPA